MIKTTLLFSLPLVITALGHANAIMIDFGPTTPLTSDLTNSPAHSASAVGLSDTTWNVKGTSAGMSGTESGLLYSDGSSADGFSFTYGSTGINSKVINYTSSISTSHALAGGTGVGVDAIFNGSGSSNDYSIGLRLDGLAAGTYDLYVASRNTNVSWAQAYSLFTSVGASSDSFDFGSASADATFSISGTDWVEGATYGVARVVVSGGESVFLGIDAIDDSQDRAFLNALQIVPVAAVPEPSTITALMGLFVGCLILGVRYRKHVLVK